MFLIRIHPIPIYSLHCFMPCYTGSASRSTCNMTNCQWQGTKPQANTEREAHAAQIRCPQTAAHLSPRWHVNNMASFCLLQSFDFTLIKCSFFTSQDGQRHFQEMCPCHHCPDAQNQLGERETWRCSGMWQPLTNKFAGTYKPQWVSC